MKHSNILRLNSGWQQVEVVSQFLMSSVPIGSHYFGQLLIHAILTLTLPSHITTINVPLDF